MGKLGRANRPLHNGRSYFLLLAYTQESAEPEESASFWVTVTEMLATGAELGVYS